MKLSLNLSNLFKKKNKNNKNEFNSKTENSSFDDDVVETVNNHNKTFDSVKKQKEQLFIAFSFIFLVFSFFLISAAIFNSTSNTQNLNKVSNDKITLEDSFRNLSLYKKQIISYAKKHNITPEKSKNKNMNNLAINYLFSLPLHAIKNNIIINSVNINNHQISNLRAINGMNFGAVNSRKFIGLKEVNFMISGKYNNLKSLDRFTKFYKNASLVGVSLNKDSFEISEVIYGN